MKLLKASVSFLCLLTLVNAGSININFSANFSQQIKSQKQTLHYEGEVLSENGKIFWRYILPERKRICADASGAIVIDDDLEQVNFVSDKFPIKQVISSAKELSADNYLAHYQGIDYYIYAPKGILKTIKYNDELGNQVKIEFRQAVVKQDCSYAKNYDEVHNK